MPWKPSTPGERPTLGYTILDWIEHYLPVVDGPSVGEPLVLTDEQAEFILKLYEVDPHFTGSAIVGRTVNNGRIIRRAVLSRPKGWGKSPLVAALCIVEAVGPVILDGWDADGQPVGIPWIDTGIKPKVQIVANSDDQTANTWDPCLDMVRSSNYLLDDYDITPHEGGILVPRGIIEPATSAGISREGYRPVFTACDQTETWTETNGGWRLFRTIKRNIAKVNGCLVETPNAFQPGDETVAEDSFSKWQDQLAGRSKVGGLLYDHREAPPETDPDDYESLREGLNVAYGESSSDNGGWVNMDRIIAEYFDTDDPNDARRYYLNQIQHASDAYVTQLQWGACRAEYMELEEWQKMTQDQLDWASKPFRVPPLQPGDAITIGFDGSQGRKHSKPDATAMVACRIWDGHLFPLGVWEAKKGEKDWTPPVAEVDATLRDAFRKYRVMAFYCDPSMWVEQVSSWEKDHGRKVRVKCSLANPFMAWPKGKGTAVREYVERLRQAIENSSKPQFEELPDGTLKRLPPEVTHDGSLDLTRHMLNARKRPCTGGYLIHKKYPESPDKIDSAYASIMAYKARLDCIARGFGVRVNTNSRGRMMVMQ